MLYVSGVHALNIEDSTECCGDWHTSAIQWSNLHLLDSESSIYGEWGIESDKQIPEHEELYYVANTLRAILDMLVAGRTRFLKGFRDDFLCTDKYNQEFFEKVYLLRDLPNWDEINQLMKREFMREWDTFVRGM